MKREKVSEAPFHFAAAGAAGALSGVMGLVLCKFCVLIKLYLTENRMRKPHFEGSLRGHIESKVPE